ncbi:hypothetical protein AUC61_03600 [Pseudomonas sp. S25]|uniref:Uncharacterized protein n=1 Tax=Pseudomonas maioricensis TaxID=1766623 RepID=A0ABS9ZDI0_9PSED|nr:hypothetical protein [Pseudomonas sp. S25]
MYAAAPVPTWKVRPQLAYRLACFQGEYTTLIFGCLIRPSLMSESRPVMRLVKSPSILSTRYAGMIFSDSKGWMTAWT